MEKVIIEGFAHYKSSAVLEGYFLPSWPLNPVAPPVGSPLGLHLLPVIVSGGDCVHPDTVGVEARVYGDRVGDVKLVNFSVQPVNLFFLVSIIVWLRAIILKPG